jgi:hypothetical protein
MWKTPHPHYNHPYTTLEFPKHTPTLMLLAMNVDGKRYSDIKIALYQRTQYIITVQ